MEGRRKRWKKNHFSSNTIVEKANSVAFGRKLAVLNMIDVHNNEFNCSANSS